MRSHYSGELTQNEVGNEVTVCGWVHYRRDFGGLLFLEVRDHTGVIQVVFDPQKNKEAFLAAEKIRREYVVSVLGKLRIRPEGTENSELATGAIEIVADTIDVLGESDPLPFYPNEHQHASEEVKLKYRYIDLRRHDMYRNLELRSKITNSLRSYLTANRFLEIETPILTKATPEGARDYLVPSRTQPGEFFALPQSPQLFKQLLMVGGVDRYYQFARCFRDEDLRADRQPEFTQLDIETSFIDEATIMQLMEGMVSKLFSDALQENLPTPFRTITYAEALESFGTDRPDFRNPLRIIEISDLMQDVEFKVFREPASANNSRVAVVKVPNGGQLLSRGTIDEYTKFVTLYKAKGLAYIKVNQRSQGIAGLQSPILKFLPDEVVEAVLERTAAADGDILFFGADKATVVNDALSALSQRIAIDLNLLAGGWEFVWVVDFPMFLWDEQAKRFTANHHPFTAPAVATVEEFEAQDPHKVLSRAYDLVLNGTELGGGSIRINNAKLQESVFKALGISADVAKKKFGFLLDALRYGCPPLGGIAFGLDRIAMLMAHAKSIREVIAFPKTQSAICPLTGAPSSIDGNQLKELYIESTYVKDEIEV